MFQREYYLLLIKSWVNKAIDHLASIKGMSSYEFLTIGT